MNHHFHLLFINAFESFKLNTKYLFFYFSSIYFQRGNEELLNDVVMSPAADNNNLDLATKKAKLDSATVNGGVGKCPF